MTQPLSYSEILKCCSHSRGRHEEMTGAGNGTPATYYCTVGGCQCGLKLPKKSKRVKTKTPPSFGDDTF